MLTFSTLSSSYDLDDYNYLSPFKTEKKATNVVIVSLNLNLGSTSFIYYTLSRRLKLYFLRDHVKNWF